MKREDFGFCGDVYGQRMEEVPQATSSTACQAGMRVSCILHLWLCTLLIEGSGLLPLWRHPNVPMLSQVYNETDSTKQDFAAA